MSLVTDLNQKLGSKPGNVVKATEGIGGAVSKLKQAKDFVDSINSLVNSVKGLASPFLAKAQSQNNSGYEMSPTVQRNRGKNQNVIYDNPEPTQAPQKVDPANVSPDDVIKAIQEYSGALPKGKKTTLEEIEKLLKELE